MSGFGQPPAPLNRALAWLLSFEGSLMRRISLPVGVGLICRARRADAQEPAVDSGSGSGYDAAAGEGTESGQEPVEDAGPGSAEPGP